MQVKTITSTDFRQNMMNYMVEVQAGTCLVVVKHKKEVFVVMPPGSERCMCEEKNEDSCCGDCESVVESVEEVVEKSEPVAPSRPKKPE